MKRFCAIVPLMMLFLLYCCSAAAFAANAQIKDLRVGVDNAKVRIVADADREVDYKSFGLRAPDRVVIDLHEAVLTPSCKREFTVNSRFVKKVKVGQFEPNIVRIVVYTPLPKSGYDVFSISNGSVPYRVVMDFGNLANSMPQAVKRTPRRVLPPISSAPVVSPPITILPQPQPLPASQGAILPAGGMSKDHNHPFSPGLAGKIIAIDPGHGGNDSGALGPNGGMEKKATLGISLKLRKLLEDAGAKVIMTRTTDTSVASPTASDAAELQARCDIANRAHADIFLSIHNDSFVDPSADGTSTYYYQSNNKLGEELAVCVRKALVAEIKRPDRGTRSCNFYVVKHTDMPATLVEAAFISNPVEEKLLMSPEGQQKVAQGIFNGIKNFFAKY